MTDYAWIEHADGVWSKRYRELELNVGAVRCEEGMLLIDTRAHLGQARELRQDLRRLSDLPVRWVINTHHHWDHTFGNSEFAGDAAVWGHERCAATLRDNGDAIRRRLMEMIPDHAADFREVTITPPEFTLDEAATVTFGGRRVDMRFLGRGHTDNDIVVALPDDGVVFAGDLVEESAPPAFADSFPLEWPDAVTDLLGIMSDRAIPGHGAVVDRLFVAHQRDDLADVARLARQHHADGMTPDQAAERGGPFPQDVMTQAFQRAWPHLDLEGQAP